MQICMLIFDVYMPQMHVLLSLGSVEKKNLILTMADLPHHENIKILS